MTKVCWPYFDPEFENLKERIHGPSCRVCIDNECCEKCTVVKVDSVQKDGLLLEAVQVLTDMDLTISKGYISSDAEWLMDVFHVRDQLGNKLRDKRLINHIQQAIGAKRKVENTGEMKTCTRKFVRAGTSSECTAIEMIAIDRPGLLSEISAVLTELKCNVVEAHAWSHNEHLACIVYISDELSDSRIDDPSRLATITDHLSLVLQASTIDNDQSGVQIHGGNAAVTHTERRLHQLLLADRDFDGPAASVCCSSSPTSMDDDEEGRKVTVSINKCNEKGYSVVNVECKDRPKLMFDTVCTLTDMQYKVFHASIASHGSFATQEYFIRRMDGCALNTESEKERVTKCLEAAIQRRVCEGVRLELCAHDRIGLLSDITRLLREYGLAVVRADVATQGGNVKNVFYVRDISGNAVDMEIVESMKREMEPLALQVKNISPRRLNMPEKSWFSLSDLLRSQIERFSHNFISIS
ncbi:ACT-like superfamily protein isoform X2 [Tasmannia lanceolata]|uniref:ACT-like superfamily protein isoform X2 n=1 Tax=Tasmannia lanceolata TaxID=3420 RepID=UPI0040632B41